jgi:hypothetical protein
MADGSTARAVLGQPIPDVIIVDAQNPQPLSPHDQAIMEAGKALLTSSITTGRDYAKTMAPVCTASITLFFTVLKVIAPNKSKFEPAEVVSVMIPTLLFLAAAICYTFAYVPKIRPLWLDSLAGIDQMTSDLIRKREPWNRRGLWLYVAGTVFMGIALAYAFLGWQATPST